ncbi:MAG: hypothetical protein LBQ01_06775, partial [Prevotellaceae bacterium]|nr:hypothetical protein [Prevotellaceae bacterium]
MTDKKYIIDALVCLGKTVTDFIGGKDRNPAIAKAIESSCIDNYWFTEENILRALDALATEMLDAGKLNEWINRYPPDNRNPQRTGLIMAGNIPLVNFHDFLSILLSGNIAVIKPSSKDRYLIKTLCGILSDRFPSLSERIVFTDAKPQDIRAVIATGSNNSARYFRAEYRNIPLLERKNRYSLAVLDGNESSRELEDLGDDIFSYFGLGCRNVSNMFVPKNYDWTVFFNSMKKYSHVLNHPGYNDCFRYQKALSELSGEKYLTDGFVIIRENNLTFSSIAAINYKVYENTEQVKTFLS